MFSWQLINQSLIKKIFQLTVEWTEERASEAAASSQMETIRRACVSKWNLHSPLFRAQHEHQNDSIIRARGSCRYFFEPRTKNYECLEYFMLYWTFRDLNLYFLALKRLDERKKKRIYRLNLINSICGSRLEEQEGISRLGRLVKLPSSPLDQALDD